MTHYFTWFICIYRACIYGAPWSSWQHASWFSEINIYRVHIYGAPWSSCQLPRLVQWNQFIALFPAIHDWFYSQQRWFFFPLFFPTASKTRLHKKQIPIVTLRFPLAPLFLRIYFLHWQMETTHYQEHNKILITILWVTQKFSQNRQISIFL